MSINNIKQEHLLTRNLQTCENCDFAVETDRFLKCLLGKGERGLLETCEKFKKKTGNHYTA